MGNEKEQKKVEKLKENYTQYGLIVLQNYQYFINYSSAIARGQVHI